MKCKLIRLPEHYLQWPTAKLQFTSRLYDSSVKNILHIIHLTNGMDNNGMVTNCLCH